MMGIKDDVNTAGDVEVMRYGVFNEFVCVLPEDLDRQCAHVTRLTAERDELNAQLESFGEDVGQLKSEVSDLEGERDGLLAEVKRLESDVSIFQNEYVRHSELEDVQDDLTKARELLSKLASDCLASDFNEHWDSYKAAIAHQSAPVAKNLTNQSPNQCDGCQAGIPVEVSQYGTPIHRMGSEGGYPDYMACTAKLYLKD